MVRKADENWCLAEVIQKRPGDDGKHFEYYVHYENYNRSVNTPPKVSFFCNFRLGKYITECYMRKTLRLSKRE